METKNVRYWECHGMELFEGTFENQCFPWHFHDTYTIILIEKGCAHYQFRETDTTVRSGEILIINPYDAHFNHPGCADRLRYRVMFVPAGTLNSADKPVMKFIRNAIKMHFYLEDWLKCMSSLRKAFLNRRAVYRLKI